MPKSSSDNSDSSIDLSDGPVVLTREQKAARKARRQRDQNDSTSARQMLSEANDLAASVHHRVQRAEQHYRELITLLDKEQAHTSPGQEDKIRLLEAEVEKARVFAEQEKRVFEQACEIIDRVNIHLQRIVNRRDT